MAFRSKAAEKRAERLLRLWNRALDWYQKKWGIEGQMQSVLDKMDDEERSEFTAITGVYVGEDTTGDQLFRGAGS